MFVRTRLPVEKTPPPTVLVPVVSLPEIWLSSIRRVPTLVERIAPPLNVVSDELALFPVVRPPVSFSPVIEKSPFVAVMLIIRDCCWASIATRSAPGPAIVSESVIASSPCVSRIAAGPLTVSAGSKRMVSFDE